MVEVNDKLKLSIVMATYNGERYIREQLDSIIPYLEEGDEILVSDDGSTDATISIVDEYINRYQYVRKTEGPHSGSSINFASAIPKCKGAIILFADQDDIWMPEKISKIRTFFREHEDIDLVMHNAGYCDSCGIIQEGDIFTRRKPRHGYLHNLIHSTYYGCCMAAKRVFLLNYIPLDNNKIPYDQYFSLFAEKKHTAAFIDEILILHRYHGMNQSKRMNYIGMIQFRMKLMNHVRIAMKRANKK